ncbi:alpha/beta hydrolase [Nocardia aurantia]|uniref:Diacylglycerol acyltransferase/mycolyltransferase Ag85A n=1 Tax=Nocardia aurantia TaxID=2585199 RepID=A0A7K0DRN4_9NOCA|nr:alpha/beta hydrolase family protein [Nocardia aurantia]MQY28425.1 Diacylglycerol acyltransferase/mycolyltransferase Ag85A [Nocardia aurantia]
MGSRLAVRRRIAAALIAGATIATATGTASADSPNAAETEFPQARPAPDGSRLTGVTPVDDRRYLLEVRSAAMDRTIRLQVIRPADTGIPAPTLYLLDGAEDGDTPHGVKTWESTTDLIPFTADKHVNVVTVIDGAYSYYTDWRDDDPVLGRNRWQTFLTEELPPVLDSAFGATGRNAIAGLSMSATSVLQLAESAPDRYRSVGSFSGCNDLDDPVCAAAVQGVLMLGKADPDNMWGPVGGPEWTDHNPATPANLEKLRGVNVVFATGNGALGKHDTAAAGNDPVRLGHQIIQGGGPEETLVGESNHRVQQRMSQLNIPATFLFAPAGTHSWPYWQDDLHAAWPSFAASLDIPVTGTP